MSRVKFVEDDTAGTPTIDFALFVVVLWPSPHLSYPGEPGASRISAPGAIQTAGFVSPASPAPARSSRSNPGQLQDLTPTDPPPPSWATLPTDACRNAWAGWAAKQMRSASASGVGAMAVRAGERWAAVRARGSRRSAGLSAMLGQWMVRAARADGPDRRCALK